MSRFKKRLRPENYDKTRPNLKVATRGDKTYYSVQVAVPKERRGVVGKSALTRYVGAVTLADAKRRAPAIVAELQAEIRVAGELAAFDQNRAGVEAFGPTPEQVAEARRVLAAVGLDVVDANVAERVTLSRIDRERESVVGGTVADATPDDGTVWGVYLGWLEYKVNTGRQTQSKARGERQRGRVAREFCEFVGLDKPFADIDHVDGQRFKAELLSKGLKAKTVDTKINGISGCFKDRRPGTLNPFAGLNDKKSVYAEQEESRADFTDSQVIALLDASGGDAAWHWYLTVAAYTGARLSELLALERGDFDFKDGLIRFNQRTIGKTPAARRSVPMHPALRGLRKYVEGCEGRPFPFSTSTVGRRFPALQAEVGATETKIDGQEYRVSFHSFRHGFKTRLLNAGVSTDMVDILIGHSRQGLNALYGKRPPPLDTLRKVVRKLRYET